MSLAQSLIDAARPFSLEKNPFIAAVRAGRCTRETLRAYAAHTARVAESFPRVLCSVLALCDQPRVRRAILGNLLEEEGAIAYVPGIGATFDPARHHAVSARRFAHAAGAMDAEIDTTASDVPRWFATAIREGNWLGAFAFFAIGFEVNVPPTYRLLIPALAEHYGFSTEDLHFLIEHVGADDRHGADGASLIESIVTTDEQRGQALEGARVGGLGWWEFHRTHARRAGSPIDA